MEEKSKQQQVFDWLLLNRDVLHSSDNTKLYNKFKKSDIPRNRLRSYKSRLKEKIEKGEIVIDDQENGSTEIENFFKNNQKIFYTIGKFIGIGFLVLMGLVLLKFLVKLFKD